MPATQFSTDPPIAAGTRARVGPSVAGRGSRTDGVWRGVDIYVLPP
jgi:hypothetical protein